MEWTRAVTAPTLVIGGEEDRVTPLQMSRDLAAALPNARLEVVPGVSHQARALAVRFFRVNPSLRQSLLYHALGFDICSFSFSSFCLRRYMITCGSPRATSDLLSLQGGQQNINSLHLPGNTCQERSWKENCACLLALSDALFFCIGAAMLYHLYIRLTSPLFRYTSRRAPPQLLSAVLKDAWRRQCH